MGNKIKKKVAIAAGICGIFEAIFGLGMMIGCFIVSGTNAHAITPYWSAVPLIISGCIGIAIWPTKNQCLLIASLVINIILVIILGISAALVGIALALWKLYLKYLEEAKVTCTSSGDNCYCDGHRIKGTCSDVKTMVSLLKLFVALSILGMIVALAMSIIGCIGLCCYTKKNKAPKISVGQGGQVVILTNQPGAEQQQQPPPYNDQKGGDPGIIAYQPPAY